MENGCTDRPTAFGEPLTPTRSCRVVRPRSNTVDSNSTNTSLDNDKHTSDNHANIIIILAGGRSGHAVLSLLADAAHRVHLGWRYLSDATCLTNTV